MPGGTPGIVAAIVAALGLGALGVWFYLKSRITPAERERRRRIAIHTFGRMGEAIITDFREKIIYYSYEIGGVGYTASQDVSALDEKVLPDESLVIGHVGLKYQPRNPANSIVVCEQWSGLRSSPLLPPITTRAE